MVAAARALVVMRRPASCPLLVKFGVLLLLLSGVMGGFCGDAERVTVSTMALTPLIVIVWNSTPDWLICR